MRGATLASAPPRATEALAEIRTAGDEDHALAAAEATLEPAPNSGRRGERGEIAA